MTFRYPYLVTTDEYGNMAWAGVWASDVEEAKALFYETVKARSPLTTADVNPARLDFPAPLRYT